MSRKIEYAGSRKCLGCSKIKPLEGFTTKGKNSDGSIRFEAKCKSCKNKGGGTSWLPRSAVNKTCRKCGELKTRSEFKHKSRNGAGEIVNWMPVCIECYQKSVHSPRLYRSDTHKTCRECKELKSLSEFSTHGRLKSGAYKINSKCKLCVNRESRSSEAKKKARLYYKRNHEQIKAQARASYQRHKDMRIAQKAIYREQNRAKIREWFAQKYAENPEYWKKQNRESYARHADKRRKYRREYVVKFVDRVRKTNLIQSKRRYLSGKTQAYNRQYRKLNKARLLEYERDYRRTDINRNIGMKLRNRINGVLRYNRKSKPTEELLACSVSELAVHLQSQFQEGMTWDKFLAGEIHIDHIVPCALFDLSLPEEQAECFHYSNLQPLWAIENLRKPKYEDPHKKRSKPATARIKQKVAGPTISNCLAKT